MSVERRRLEAWIRRAAPVEQPDFMRRRTLLRMAGAMAACAAWAPRPLLGADTAPRFRLDPFACGVASGSPRSNSVVIWTRLVRHLQDGVNELPGPVTVGWELADDPAFRKIVRKGATTADPAFGHSVHVEVGGLDPSRWYWYRFMAGDAVSPPGRTRTAPAPDASVDRLRFAFASCQNYQHGHFAAHRQMAGDELDFVVFLGDYIYETEGGRNLVRTHAGPEPRTLDQYRDRYALYKSDPHLQSSHAAAPWIVTWDDHEVENDYADDRSEELDADFLVRRAAAYRAFYENMPLARTAVPRGPAMQMYDSYHFGDLAQFCVLDDRQYRAYQACPRPGRGGSNTVEDCPERAMPDRSLLGAAQEAWLKNRLVLSSARWNVIAQQTLMAQRDRKPGPGQRFFTDGWDGYPAARSRLLDDVAQSKASNPLVISGDVHCTWFADLKRDFDDPKSPVVASELCGTSISSRGPGAKEVMAAIAENPHLHYGNGHQRGYIHVDMRRNAVTATLRAVANVLDPDSALASVATYLVQDGRPGVVKA